METQTEYNKNLKEYFDKIYCIQLVEDEIRRKGIIDNLTETNYINEVSMWNVCRHPYDLEIIRFLNKNNMFEWNAEGNGGVYGCTIEHYSIIYQAFKLGYKHILIMEDDTLFSNRNAVSFTLSNIPTDYDIIRFAYIDENKFKSREEVFKLYKKRKAWGTGCYALSRKGMKYYIDYMDNHYSVADMPLYDMKAINNRGLKCYFYEGLSIITGNYKSNLR